MPVTEEGVRVRDALVSSPGDAEHSLAPAHVRERKAQSLELEAGAGGDQLGDVVLVLAVARATREPEAVVTLLRRPQSCEGEDVDGIDLLAGAEGLEHGSARKLVGRV